MYKILIKTLMLAWLVQGYNLHAQVQKPNIILVYIDDLGYGDVSCYGAKSITTPNIDRLAKNGLRFADGHCTAATCTPSRFSLLTGSYAFRNNAAILPGDAPLLIRPGTKTMASMFKNAGYRTGVVGKWHLGLGNGYIDWNNEIKPGPLEIGFDYSFLVPATLDRVPTVYVENHRVLDLDPMDPIKVDYNKDFGVYPTGLGHPELLKFGADTQHSNTITNGISRIGFMAGGKSALWKDEDMPIVFLEKVKSFINESKNDPFFLYYSFTDIHVPRAPNDKFKNKSSMGYRGDVIAQMDWSVGELMKLLQSKNLDKNTLIIFSSDNGPVLNDGYDDKAEQLIGTHKPSGTYKGGKYSAFEGGTRVPTIVYWPGHVKTGVSNALINQVDLFASFAKLTGQQLTDIDAPDSFDQLDVWLGKSAQGRKIMLEESFTLAVRVGDWKYIQPVSKEPPAWFANKNIPSGLEKFPQLYNLKEDIEEKNNAAARFPKKVQELQEELTKIQQQGSRPGYKK
jgi:arylsulfatase A